MNSRYLILAAVACCVCAAGTESNATTLGTSQLAKLVQTSGVLPKGYDGCSVTLHGDDVYVWLNKHPGDTADDIKVNAVMVGKTVMEKDPSVDLVRVHFVERSTLAKNAVSQTYTFVDVSSNDIKSFAAGLASKQNLLKSLALHQYTTGATMLQVAAGSVGKGADQLRREGLFATVSRLSGYEWLHGEAKTPEILPTIDKFATEMKQINELAQSGASESVVGQRVTRLDEALHKEIQSFKALMQRQPEVANKQVRDYMIAHNMPVPGNLAPAQPAPALLKSNSVNAVKLPSGAEFQALMQKYPQFVPARNDYLYRRRQMLAWRLMVMADSGKAGPDLARDFSDVESAAKTGDTVALNSRIKTLERRIGWVYTPGPDGQ